MYGSAGGATHPSIWINPTIKASLQQQVTDNTAEWQVLKAYCDDNIGANLSGIYQAYNWKAAALNYGLCFQATGNQTYGNEGVIYLTAMLRDQTNVGDGLGGDGNIQFDSGYGARNLGIGVAVARDWLDGATDLTTALETEAVDRLEVWIDWVLSSGFARDDPYDNYYSGYFGMIYTAGYAFVGEDVEADFWLTQAEDMWSNGIVPLFSTYLSGGEWVEGWNYGEDATRTMMTYPHAVFTSTGSSSAWADGNYHKELVSGHLRMLYPGGGYFSDDGSWSGSYKGNPWKATVQSMLSVAPLTATEQGHASWYLNNVTWSPIPSKEWEEFLWRNTTTPITPTTSTMGGLSAIISGSNRLLARSGDWDNVSATYVEFGCKTYGLFSQDERNVGEFKIASRGELLVVDSDSYQDSSDFANVLMIDGAHRYAPYQEWWHDDVTVARSFLSDAISYVRGGRLDNAYDTEVGGGLNPSVSFYTREFIYIAPDYVFIMDTVVPTAQAVNTITSQVNFMGNPTISGNTTVATNGTARVFMSVLGHSVSITKTDKSATRAGVWLSSIAPSATAANYKLLHVLETAPSSQSSMTTTTEIIGTNFRGAQVGNSVAMFNASATNVDQTTGAYSFATTTATSHVLTGLSAGTTYNLVSTGTTAKTLSLYATGGTFVVGTDGTLPFTVEFDNTIEGGAEIPLTNAPAILNGSAHGLLNGSAYVVIQ